MTRLCLLTLGCCSLLTACGDEPQGQVPVEYRVVATCPRQALVATLAQHADVALVLVLDGSGAELAAGADKLATIVVGIGSPPSKGEPMPQAVVVAPSGAEVAVELALLACNGVYVPKTPMPIGARLLTAAAMAAGGSNAGEPQTAPGDVVLQLLRRQHAAVLTTTPSTDEIHRIGLIQVLAQDAWQTATAGAVANAARRFPQLELQAVTGQDAQTLTEQLVAQGCRAVMVTSGDPAAVAAVLQAASLALDGPATVIVLDPLVADHGTCCVGCSPSTLGRAAAEATRQLLPTGGSILTVAGDPDSPLARQRHQGFVDALGLD